MQGCWFDPFPPETVYMLACRATVPTLERHGDEASFDFCGCRPAGIICCSTELCDYERFEGPDSDLMTKLQDPEPRK